MGAKVWAALALTFAAMAALLFVGAGTVRWLGGWVLLILFFAESLRVTLMLARRDPALLAERMKSPLQKGQPLWDKIFLLTLQLTWCAWVILMALDAVRFGWSRMPVWLNAIGSVGFLGAYQIIDRVMRENTFLAPVVKIQKERGQRVISTGPYARVRHPLYAAALLLIPCIPLILGSWYGLAASLVFVVGIAFRTLMEERELRRGLEGYPAYMQQVRYRLVPFLW
jgi:protein-S-isoprenylcysteine O-methyltransferase Ste14